MASCNSNPFTNQPVCDEPPLGGAFATGAQPSDISIPQYIAVSADESRAYLTYSKGVKDTGRLAVFKLITAPQCLLTDPVGNCTTAVNQYISASSMTAVFGTHTLLDNPRGVSVVAANGGDEVFVANFDANSLIEFGPGAVLQGGDVAPMAVVKGLKTDLNEPVGIQVIPPPLIP